MENSILKSDLTRLVFMDDEGKELVIIDETNKSEPVHILVEGYTVKLTPKYDEV